MSSINRIPASLFLLSSNSLILLQNKTEERRTAGSDWIAVGNCVLVQIISNRLRDDPNNWKNEKKVIWQK